MRVVRPTICLTLLALWPSAVTAQTIGAGDLLRAADAAQGNLPPDTLGGELLFGQIDEDIFATLQLRLNFDRENWGIGVLVPLRFRLIDRPPDNEGDFALLRKEDWDEVSDFLKVIRYVYVGRRDKKGPFYVRVGELTNLTVGHGTIVHRYTNGINLDRFRIGANVAVNVGAFGGEAVVGDVSRIGSPVLAGFRVTARPLSLIFGGGSAPSPDESATQVATSTPGGAKGAEARPAARAPAPSSGSYLDNLLSRVVVGFSVMSDPNAPFELATQTVDNADGTTSEQVAFDDDDCYRRDGNGACTAGSPLATRERTLVIAGVDLGVELLQSQLLRIEPYMDLNKMNVVDGGWGFHLGVLWGLSIPVLIDTLVVDLRTEYRRVSGDYIGPYFDTLYEIERSGELVQNGSLSTATKLRLLHDGAMPGRNGVFFDLLAGLPSFVYVGGEFIDYDGGQADGTLRLSLHVPALEFVQVSAFYYRTNISGFDDFFALDERSALVAEAKVPIASGFTVNARWWRVWETTPEGPQSVDDWSIGAGFSLAL